MFRGTKYALKDKFTAINEGWMLDKRSIWILELRAYQAALIEAIDISFRDTAKGVVAS